MGYSKKKRKDGMPKKHDPKKNNGHNNVHEKKGEKKKIYIYIAMSSCYPNKRERDPQKEYSMSTIHLRAQS